MANPALALQHLGKLLGLFPADGGVAWTWFDDPEQQTLASLLANRDEIADIIAALVTDGDRETTQTFGSAALHWEPFPKVGPFEIGLVWTADPAQPLQVGVAAKVTEAPAALDIVVWLFELAKQGAKHEFRHLLGNGQISGSLDITDAFVTKLEAQLALAIDADDPVTGAITVTAADAAAATLESTTPLAVLPWDLARMATFIVGAWLRWSAARPGADEAVKRVAYHLLPMFGGPGAPSAPANPIAPLPLFAPMKSPVDDAALLAWPKSLVEIDGMSVDTAGAQRFLWHGRALLTGNESAGLFDGSVLVQLEPQVPGGGPLDGLPPVFTSDGAVPSGQALKLLGARWENLAGKQLEVFHRQTHANGTPPTDAIMLELDTAWKPKFLADLAALATPPVPVSASLDFQKPQPELGFHYVLGGVAIDVGVANGKPVVKLGGNAIDGTAGFIGSALSILDALLGDKGQPWLGALGKLVSGDVVAGVQQLLAGALDLAGAPNPITLLDQPLPDGLGSIAITLAIPPAAPPKFAVEIRFEVGDLLDGIGIHVGEVGFGFALALPLDQAPTFEDVSIDLSDLRLVPEQGIGALVAQFLPDLTEVGGFALKVVGALPAAPFFRIEGGGRIPIQQKLGPLELRSLLVQVGMKVLTVTVDATLDLSGIVIAPYELGLAYDFKTGKIAPKLDGLGLSMDLSGLVMGGMFAKYQPPGAPDPDYLGALQISVFDLFQLSAIGGYSQFTNPNTNKKEPSLFIFANLDAPLGGPPYFFVTGISGGFGLNRRLPPVFPLADNPFLKVMRGEIAFDPAAGMRESLESLGKQFAVTPGGFWVAAGLEFTSCGFINGTLGAAIGINPFQLQLFGAAGFGIEDLALIELEFGVVVDQEKVLTIAGLSNRSYLIHPDLFGLRGQFGLGVWHSGVNQGDFVLTVGGYHPLYKKPEHYPDIDRIEVRATLWGFVNLSVSCFFACTPRELMAGAAVALWGEFAGISAGLDVYVDVLIKWDPFYLLARMGVCVWFEFMGRHEIGVDLELHTPPFGGSATIDLALVSFTIEFGDNDTVASFLPVGDFVERQLRLTPHGSGKVKVPTLSSASEAGLFRLDVGWGRTVERAESKDDEAQEGLAANAPIPVQSEFGVVVKSRLPLMDAAAAGPAPTKWTGVLHLPLCGKFDRDSEVRVIAAKANSAAITPSATHAAARCFPAALYSGEAVSAAQMENRAEAIAASSAAEKVVEGAGAYTLDYQAEPVPKTSPVIAATSETETDPDEFYPLPLGGAILAQAGRLRRRTRLFGGVTKAARAQRQAAKQAAATKTAPLIVREAAIPRVARPRVGLAMRIAQASATPGVAGGVPVMPVPASPARRRELADVTLRMLPRAAVRARRAAPRQLAVNRLAATARRPLIGRPVARDPQRGLHVAPGRAIFVELARDGAARGTLHLTAKPRQVVRAIFLGGAGRPVADVHTIGPAALPIPPRSRSLVLIGEEEGAPLFRQGTPMGLEAATRAVALDGNTFAAHGCVVELDAGLDAIPPALTAVPGRELLRVARQLTIEFPALRDGAAVLFVRAIAASPAPVAQQVRWRARDAALGAIRAVTRGDAIALVVPVTAPGAWALEVSIGADYRLDGIVALPGDDAALARELAGSNDWTLLDETWSPLRARAAAPQPLTDAALARVEILR